MFEYIQLIRLSARTELQLKIDLQEEVRGWLLLRRAALKEEQKTLVMSQVGMTLTLERVAVVLQSTCGQQLGPQDTDASSALHDEFEKFHALRGYHWTLWTDDNPIDEWCHDYSKEIG